MGSLCGSPEGLLCLFLSYRLVKWICSVWRKQLSSREGMFLVNMSQITGERELTGNVSKSTKFRLRQNFFSSPFSLCIQVFLLLLNILPFTGNIQLAVQRSSVHPEEPVYLFQNTTNSLYKLFKKILLNCFKGEFWIPVILRPKWNYIFNANLIHCGCAVRLLPLGLYRDCTKEKRM